MIEPDQVGLRRQRLVGRLRRVVGPRGGPEARPATLVPLPRRKGPTPGRAPFEVPATPGFIGRADELARLVAAPDGLLRRHRVVVLAGDRGAGTSWLLSRAAHDSWDAGLLRDGRIHVDLRPAAGPPLTARQALDRMAERAGVGELPAAAAASDAEAAGHLRQLLSGQRILFLIDNVDDPARLGPLLAVQCHLLVAGGPALRGLPGAAVVDVPRLGRRDAVGLCEQSHPRRHREDRDDYERAVATIGRLFASQPKVLYELGGRGDRRRPPAAVLALGLQRVLDAPPYVAVDQPDAVDAACRHHGAYATLSDHARRVARLLAMVTDPIPPGAVAALTTPPATVHRSRQRRRVIEALTAPSIPTSPPPTSGPRRRRPALVALSTSPPTRRARRRPPGPTTPGPDTPGTARWGRRRRQDPVTAAASDTTASAPASRRSWLRRSAPTTTGSDASGTTRRWGRRSAIDGARVDAPAPTVRRGRPRRSVMVTEALAELDAAGFLERRGSDLRLAPALARLCRLHLHRDEPVRRRARAYVRLQRYLAREAARQAEHLASPVASPTPRTTAAERAAARAADEWFDRHRRLLHRLVAAPILRHTGDSGRWRRTARITGARWAAGGQVEVAFPKSRRARRAWWEGARALQAWYERQGHDHRGRALCRSVHTVAAATGMIGVEGWAAHRLGVVALRRGDWSVAVDDLAGIGRGWGRIERAPALTNRGVARLHLGHVDQALADLRAARRLRSRRDPVGTGLTDLGLGEAWQRHGRPDRARTHLVAAANAFDGTDDAGLAAALANLVLVEAAQGRMTVAVRTAEEAERVYRGLGDDAGATEVRLNTAIALLTFAPPRPAQADDLLTGLITELAERPPTPLLARVLLHAGDAARLRDRPATARLLWARAADTARQVDDPATPPAPTHRLTQ